MFMKRLIAAVVMFSAPAVMANDLDDLVARVMNAYGGEAAWAKVTSLHQTGSVSSPMRPAPGKLTRDWQRPDKLRIEVVYPTSTEVRVVEGDKGTQNGKEASGMGLDAMRLQAARLALPYLLAEKKTSLRDAGSRDKLRLLEIPLTAPMTLMVEVDSENGHIVRSIGKSTGIEFATMYSEFRKVDGLLFAFHEENYAQGAKTAATDIAAVEVNR
jgi:hypothetical protein